MKDIKMAQIASFLLRRSGLSLDESKQYLLQSRLMPVCRKHGLKDLAELSNKLMSQPKGEIANETVEAMTTNETLFFRDMRPFETIRHEIFPGLLKGVRATPVKVWSAASSRGQEAYSLAMIMKDLKRMPSRFLKIIGTDIDKAVIEYANNGIYTQNEVQRGLSVTDLVQNFEQVDKGFQVHSELRSLATFKYLNLIDPAAMRGMSAHGPFDVIMIRNVLIYMTPEQRAQVIDMACQHLTTGGSLFLGATERMADKVRTKLEQVTATSGARYWTKK